jgi:hypothetical protein
MTKTKISVVLFLIAIVLIYPTYSVVKPDYSGKWKLNIEKSDFGALPAPEEVIITITHKEPRINLDIHQVSMQGDLDAAFDLTTDGKKTDYQVGGAEITSTMVWENENLKLNSDIYVNGMEIDYQDIWALSDGGSVLTIERDMASAMGETSQILVFEKQ